MNIGVDIKAFKNGTTGINKYMRCILDELQRIDSTNRYYLFDCKGTGYAPTNPNWRVVFKKTKLPSTIVQQLFLPGLLKKYDIDVLWAPEQICPVLWRFSRPKIVTTVHDFVALRYPDTCQKTDLMIKRMFGAPSVRRSRALVPVSDYIKNELLEFYPDILSDSKIIRTVSNGVNGSERVNRSLERENFLFFPGNLEPRKNLSRLVKALEIVNGSGFDIYLHICGPSGWKNSDFHELTKTSAVKDRVRHLGYLSEDDLADQYLRCKALIYPSIYEGFGIPVLEALKFGAPVLTSKGTVMEEIAGDSAMYFDPLDVGSIAAAIIDFLKSEPIAVNAELLKKYTWKRSAESLLEVFTDVYNM